MNAVFSIISGVLLISSNRLAVVMEANRTSLIVVGVGLLFFAATVWLAAVRKTIKKAEVIGIVIQDWVWVAASTVVVLTQALAMSPLAYTFIVIVAVIVSIFATLQKTYLSKTLKDGH